MVRKLGLTVFGLGALLPGLASAFGLGEITLKSALNQPLDATISLSKVGDLGVSEIIPKLASRKDFEQAGVGRVFFLTDIQFEVLVDGEGGASILLKSNKPVKEPFLNFIIEVEWPQGRLLREYTVLLDPPIFSEKAPAQVIPPSTEYQRVPTAPASSVQPPVTIAPQENVSRETTSASAAPQASQAFTVPQGATPQTYGRTLRDDNLWNIAAKVRPERSVNIQQTMLAIQDLNPDSFIDENINLLKRGQILRIPTLEQIRSRGARAAIGGVSEQNNKWRQLLSSKRNNRPVDAPQLDGSGRVSSVDNDSQGDRGRLKILAANTVSSQEESGALGSEAGADGSSKVSALQQELALSEEKVDSLSLANKELNDRIASIEGQLGTSEHILELKDNQIAAMQAKLIVLEKQIKEALGDDAVNMNEGGATAEASVESSEPDLAVNDATAAIDPSVQETTDASAADVAVAKEAKQVAAIPDDKVDLNTEEKSSSFDQVKSKLQENPMYLVAAVGVLAIIMLAVVGARRRRPKAAEHVDVMDGELEDFEDFEAFEGASESASSESGDEVSAEVSAFDDDGQEPVEAQDESESTTPEAVKGELGDAIGEADIYIAYGRYSHAIDLLRQAVSNEPDRIDVKMKLLEVFAETDNAEAFAEFEAEVLPLADELLELKIAEYRSNLSNAVEPALDAGADEPVSDDLIPELGAELANDFEASDVVESNPEDLQGIETLESGLDIDLDLEGDSEIEALEAELDSEVGEFDAELGASSDDLDSALGGLSFGEDDSSEMLNSGEEELAEDFSFQESEASIEDDSVEGVVDVSESDIEGSNEASLDFDISMDLDESLVDGEGAASADEELSFSLEGEIEASVEAELEEGLAQSDELGLTDNKEVEIALADFETEESADDFEVGSDLAADAGLDGAIDTNMDTSEGFDFELDVEGASAELGDDIEQEIAASNDDLQFESTEQLEDEIAELEESLQDAESFDMEPSNEEGEDSFGLDDNIVSIDSNQTEPEESQLDATDDQDQNVEVESDELEVSLAESDEISSLDEEDDKFGFLADTDESATKLDLARAYIDMGDKDGAKDILQEVLSEGSDIQKQDANELLARIA